MARENCFYQDIFNYIVHGSIYPDATESKKNELLKEAIQYTVIQGNLYRTFPPSCKKLRLVLSKQINQKIAICESHISNDDHLNVKETCLNVRKKYYWKNIDNDVVEFIKQCPDCSEDNKSFPIKAKHQQYECLDRVWKLVEITVVGPLTYNETKVYLFRLVDVFSKWMCFHKLNSLDPKEISKILLKEFSVLGFPVGIRLVELENSEEIISLFENEIKEFIKKTKEVNKIFNNDDLTNDLNSGEVDLHQNEIDHSPKVNSECSNLPNSEELTNCPVEVNGDGNNNSNSSIGDNNETGDTNNNDNGDNDNNSSSSNNNNNSSNTNEADITPVEKTEEQSDFKPDEIKTTEIEVEEANKESVSDLTNSIPNGSDSVLQENTLNSTLENEILLQRINESDDFLINKINDFEIFLDNQNEDTKPFIYIFIGEKSIVDSETENLYKDKLEKFINHFPDLWVEYLPNFILNVQSSASSSFQTPSQVMFHREPNLIGLFESSYLNHSIQFLGNSVENQPPVKNDVANGSCKLTRTSGRMKRYSLRQSPKPNESLGFFNDYIRTSPIKRTSRSVNKKDFPPSKMRRLASKQDLIHSLVEKYCLKDTFVVLQPLPSKVVESALAGNVKVANPVLVNEKEVPVEAATHSLPTSSKEIDSEEMNEANKENNENHSQPEQEVAVR